MQPKFYHDPATNVIALKPNGPQAQVVTIQLPVPAAMALLRFVRRMNNVFNVTQGDAVNAFQASLEEVLRSEEQTQRLDPAFAGPAEPIIEPSEQYPQRSYYGD